MQVYDFKDYEWNHRCAPHGNLGRLDPELLSIELDKKGIPWYTTGWPYSSGLYAYCDDETWKQLCDKCREG